MIISDEEYIKFIKDGGMRYINHVRVSAGKLVEVSRVMDFYRILEKFDA